MLISRQGVGGNRAQTHRFQLGGRTDSLIVIAGRLSRGALSSPGTRCKTAFDPSGTPAEIDKEVAS